MVTKTGIQIRFADVDMLGHVNNVNLQHFFDLGKNDFMRHIMKLDFDWHKEGFITASTETSYLAQTKMEDNVHVETCVEKIGNKSLTFSQRLVSTDNGELRAVSRTVLVAFDFELQHSIVIPEKWRDKLDKAGTCTDI